MCKIMKIFNFRTSDEFKLCNKKKKKKKVGQIQDLGQQKQFFLQNLSEKIKKKY